MTANQAIKPMLSPLRFVRAAYGRMLIYLDQNKWIALARMLYGKDKSQLSKTIVKNTLKVGEDGRIIIVLSAIHYIETARISNSDRRKRLGKVMWKYSKGKTLASYKKIVIHELKTALCDSGDTILNY